MSCDNCKKEYERGYDTACQHRDYHEYREGHDEGYREGLINRDFSSDSYESILQFLASKINNSKWEEEKLIQALQDYVNPNIGVHAIDNK